MLYSSTISATSISIVFVYHVVVVTICTCNHHSLHSIEVRSVLHHIVLPVVDSEGLQHPLHVCTPPMVLVDTASSDVHHGR